MLKLMFLGGMPIWSVIGLPDTSIKESKDRIKTAIKNCGVELLSRKYIINLSPADIRKEGSGFDLAMAVGILQSIGIIKNFNNTDTLFIGELSLDSKINKINGVLPMCVEAKKLGIKEIIVPKENAKEAAIVQGLKIIPAYTLLDIIEYLNKQKQIKEVKVNTEELFSNYNQYTFDFSEVKGQENIKRALEIAAARST